VAWAWRPALAWPARYRDPSGKQRGRVFRTKAEATRYLQRVGADIQRGDYLDPRAGKTTFASVAADWLAAATDLTAATRAGYETSLARHLLPAFGGTSVARIQPSDVRKFVGELAARRAPGTVRNNYFLLKAILDLAVTDGAIKSNPAAGLARDRKRALPRSRKQEMQFLTADQVQALANWIGPTYSTLIITAAYTGLRAGELTALRVTDVNLAKREIHVRRSITFVEGKGHVEGQTKSRQERRVPLPAFLALLLAKRVNEAEPDAFVFTNRQGEMIKHNTFYRSDFKPAVRNAGLNPALRYHDLRHTAASLLIASGAHPKAVCDWLGHSTITITMDRYGHLYPGALTDLADKLDAVYRTASSPAPSAAEVVALR
jgi:integrase